VTVANAEQHVLLDCASQLRSPYTGLAPKDESEHETDPERGKDRFRRVLADVLLAVVLKTADATARIIPFPFRRGQGIHRPSGLRPSADLPPLCGRSSRHSLLFLPPAAAKPQGLDSFGFR